MDRKIRVSSSLKDCTFVSDKNVILNYFTPILEARKLSPLRGLTDRILLLGTFVADLITGRLSWGAVSEGRIIGKLFLTNRVFKLVVKEL